MKFHDSQEYFRENQATLFQEETKMTDYTADYIKQEKKIKLKYKRNELNITQGIFNNSKNNIKPS